jgi:hypothetical protein
VVLNLPALFKGEKISKNKFTAEEKLLKINLIQGKF